MRRLHPRRFEQLYSNANLDIQFLVLVESRRAKQTTRICWQAYKSAAFTTMPMAPTTRDSVVYFTFPNNLPSAATAGRRILIGPRHSPTSASSLRITWWKTSSGIQEWSPAPLQGSITTPFMTLRSIRKFLPTARRRFSGMRPTNDRMLPSISAGQTASVPATPASSPTGMAVEYYHAGFDHYFLTTFPDEIAVLDGGAFGGVWKRTGQSFKVWTKGSATSLSACRFFSTSFAPKSSHFYTPFAAECATVKANPDWQFEAVAFFAQLADADGNCGAGTVPLYRLYNNGMGGAPNHRYTTSLTCSTKCKPPAGYSKAMAIPKCSSACRNSGGQM